LRECALGALRRISGLGLPAEPDLWRTWAGKESVWQDQDESEMTTALADPDPVQVTIALRACAGRRAWRATVAEDVIEVLERPEPGLRRLACEVLTQLGVPASVKALVPLLEDDDESVATAAWQAIRTLSGLELPRDADRVREILRLD